MQRYSQRNRQATTPGGLEKSSPHASRRSETAPELPRQDGCWKRRTRLAETIVGLMGAFASHSPGHQDRIVLLDSTLAECGRSVETAGRSRLADACSRGYSRS